MKTKEPFILRFKSEKDNPYIYDVCTNLVFNCPDEMIEILNLYNKKNKEEIVNYLEKKYSLEKLEKKYNNIAKLVKNYQAFFSSQKNKNPKIKFTKENFKKEISNCSLLSLNITEQCNLRCKYCAFSGLYKFNRTHSTKNMSFNIAKKSIYYFFSLLSSNLRTEKKSLITIAFYGGEPLLKFKLIKECIKYTKTLKKTKKFKGKINFRIATNGILLDDKMLDFIIKNSVLLQISLNGPKSENDKFRVFKGNEGSFDIVWRNIRKIKEKNEDYYKKNVTFITVFSAQSDLLKINNFFSNQDYFKHSRFMVSMVDSRNTEFNNIYKMTNAYKRSYKKLHKLFCSYLKKNKKDKITSYMKALFRPYYTLYDALGYSLLNQKSFYTSTCIPGSIRLFVSTDGNFHMCERVNEYFPIGNYKTGIEYNKVRDIYSNYIKQVTQECAQCKVAHLCTVCFAQACEDGKFNCKEICKNLREKLPKDLSTIISILEENKEAFEIA